MKIHLELDQPELEILARLIAEQLQTTFRIDHSANAGSNLLTLEETCQLLQCSKSAIYRYRKKGLKSHSKGKKVFFLRLEIEKWITK